MSKVRTVVVIALVAVDAKGWRAFVNRWVSGVAGGASGLRVCALERPRVIELCRNPLVVCMAVLARSWERIVSLERAVVVVGLMASHANGWRAFVDGWIPDVTTQARGLRVCAFERPRVVEGRECGHPLLGRVAVLTCGRERIVAWLGAVVVIVLVAAHTRGWRTLVNRGFAHVTTRAK